MGTNFYFDEPRNEDTHIGKRSAAGLFCWDCEITLCMGGPNAVHEDTHEWFDRCPMCGKEPEKEGVKGSVGRELGWNDQPMVRKHGVRSCSSFTWDMPPLEVVEQINSGREVYDEYGRTVKLQEVMRECPIHIFTMLGRAFS